MSAHEPQDQSIPPLATPLVDVVSPQGGKSKSRLAAKPKGATVVPKPAPFYRQFGHGPKY